MVVPAFRAARTIAGVIERVTRSVPDAAVIVVDDGSADGTAAAATAAGASVLNHDVNQGKGRALATGLVAALALQPDYVVTLDADGQHPPESIPALLGPLQRSISDLVVGARPREAGVMPPARRLSNWLSSTLVSRATGTAIPDSQSGFRAMTRAVAHAVRPAGRRYEYETEFLLEAARQHFRIGAVSIPAVYEGEASHFRYVGDTLRLSWVFARHWRQLFLGAPTHYAPRTTHPS